MQRDGFNMRFDEVEQQMGRELFRVLRKGRAAAASHCEEDGGIWRMKKQSQSEASLTDDFMLLCLQKAADLFQRFCQP